MKVGAFMKKFFVRVFPAILLMAGLLVGVTIAWAAPIISEKVQYRINENGQTYGSIDPTLKNPAEQEPPQLIAAIGVDGTNGYVKLDDINKNKPTNPDEAVRYMEELEAAVEKARNSGSEYLELIPLYDSDGETIIGEFGISYP